MSEFAICSRAAGEDIVGLAPASTVISIVPSASLSKSSFGHPISTHRFLNFVASLSPDFLTRRRTISEKMSPIWLRKIALEAVDISFAMFDRITACRAVFVSEMSF